MSKQSNTEWLEANWAGPDEQQMFEKAKATKRNQLIAGLGDTISSLSNLFFTTKGAPNAFTTPTMTDAANKKYEDMLQRHQQNRIAYMNAKKQAQRDDKADAITERNWQYNLQQAADAKRLADEQLQYTREKEQRDYELKVRQSDDLKEYRDKTAENYLERTAAMERNAKLKASGKYSSQNSRFVDGKGYPWYDIYGDVHYSNTYQDMFTNAQSNGTWVHEEKTSTTSVNSGNPRRNYDKTTTTQGRGYSAPPANPKPKPGTEKKKDIEGFTSSKNDKREHIEGF